MSPAEPPPPPPEDETIPEDERVPEDDAVIGAAFRRSLIVIGALVCLLAPLPFLLKDEEVAEEVRTKDLAEILDRRDESEEAPPLPFTDVTDATGISFVHENGARGEKLLPETMGAGVAFLDHDGDGDQDLLFANGRPWTHDAPPDGDLPTPALFANDGRGRFTDVTAACGLDLAHHGTGVAAADLDGDGLPEVHLAALGANRLLRNHGGRFVDVTADAGVAGDEEAWSTGAVFSDLDGDGDLDLFVCNYVTWSREIDAELAYSLNGTDRAYGPPTNYTGAFCVLYRNDTTPGGPLRFTDVSEEAGVRVTNRVTGVPAAKALGVVAVDVDRDGDRDLVVANDTVANFLFVNRGDGTFEERGDVAGVAFDGAGRATGAMGIDVAEFRDDGALGIAIGNFANEMTSLFVSSSDAAFFSDDAIGEGIGAPSRLGLTFGLFFFDADLDGRLDLLSANGDLEETIREVQPSQRYRQPAQLFWNRGDEARSCFTPLPAEATGDLARPIAGRGAAYGDVDGDGDLDVVLTESGGRPRLLRNDQATGHHSIRLRLVGPPENRDAIGARIAVRLGDRTLVREVRPQRSYLSQVELPTTIGLGDRTTVDEVSIRWPDGTERVVEGVAIDAETVVRR